MADDGATSGGEAVSDEEGEDQLPGSNIQQQQQSHGTTVNTTSILDPVAVLGQEWCSELSVVAQCLEDLGLSAASEEAYTRVINSYVLQQIRTLATEEFDTAVLPRAQQLICAGPLTFLQLLLSHSSQLQAQLQEWRLRLTYLMLETLGALRSSDMFNIVIDFPESSPALQDLVLCLQHTNMAGQFAATFRAALEHRLLHAGAATADIIHTYVSTIRAMTQVDPSGMLLDVISHPIRSYLRSRPDTIRCIVSLLTGQSFCYNWCVSEQEGEEAALKLLEALEAGADLAHEESAAAAEQSGALGLSVCPPSTSSAALLGPGAGRVEADVVSMLIGIYGGPLLFMEEYRQMLADRLLAKDEYDCEKEVRTLELLKIRFGDAGLHPCEVMLKDLADSKRLDANRRGSSGDVEYKRATSIDPSRIVSFEDTDMSWRGDSGTASTAEDRIVAEMGPYENYIIGLLTNFGTLALDRMHNLLRVFVVGEPKYTGQTQEQLAAFLQVLVVQEKIELHNGVYSKRRAAAAS
eukprot:gene8508-8690_t